MRARPLPGLLRLLDGRVGGPLVEDAAALSGELVRSGRQVGLEHLPVDGAALIALAARLSGEPQAAACEVTIAVGVLPAAAEVAARVREAGLGVVLDGPPVAVDPVARAVPGARVVVRAGDPGAEERCRELADRRVRLVQGRRGAALPFVRCLNVLMSGAGDPAVVATDPRLVAIAGERAAWFDRPPESWEHAMPSGVRTDEQRRLTAAGHRVRVLVPWGPGAPAAVARRLAGRA